MTTSIVSNKGCTPELINERMMKVRMNLTGKSNSVPVIVTYAPTDTAPLEDKFWTQLGAIVKTVPKKDQLFLLIDANARTGSRDGKVGVERKRALGPFGRDVENDHD